MSLKSKGQLFVVIRYFKGQSLQEWKLLTQSILAQFSLEYIFGRKQVNIAAINATWNERTTIPVLFSHSRDHGQVSQMLRLVISRWAGTCPWDDPWGEEVRYQNIQLYLFSSDVCCVLQSTLDFTKQYIGMIQDIWDHFY